MKILEIIVSAFNNVSNYKLRSFLTMLGIIIGIGAVITITSIGMGVKTYIFSQMEMFNKSTIQIMPNFSNNSENMKFTLDEIDSISKIHGVNSVSAILSVSNQSLMLRNGIDIKEGNIIGLDENYRRVQVFNISYGRYFTENDIKNKSFVAIITEDNSLEIFGRVNSVGEKVEVKGPNSNNTFTIIGVIGKDKSNMKMKSPIYSSLLLIPITTGGQLNLKDNEVTSAIVEVKEGINSKILINNIKNVLNIKNEKEDGYIVKSLSDVLTTISSILSGITAFVTFAGSISLFIAGVGVMNIMIVTVTERTREIGIRKSLGSTNMMIKIQFIMEAIILTTIGGIFGVIFGFLFSNFICYIANNVFNIDIIAKIDFIVVLYSFLISLFIGIIFGVYPAWKAAKLDPVDALRY